MKNQRENIDHKKPCGEYQNRKKIQNETSKGSESNHLHTRESGSRDKENNLTLTLRKIEKRSNRQCISTIDITAKK